MTKYLAFGLYLASLLFSSLAEPIFLLSSGRIDHFSDNLFLDQEEFNNNLHTKILQSKENPNNIFLFNIRLNDKSFINNPTKILKELSRYPSLQKYFGASSNTFSSGYVKEAFSNGFTDKMLDTIQSNNFQLLQTNMKEFNFDALRNLKKNTNQNVASVVNLPLSELRQLDELFHSSYSGFGTTSRNNHLIILKFTDDTPMLPTILATLSTTERMLQDTPIPETDEPTTTPTQNPTPIGISPAGLAGYIISIFGLIGIYYGFEIMFGIKAQSKFYKDQLPIGKEH